MKKKGRAGRPKAENKRVKSPLAENDRWETRVLPPAEALRRKRFMREQMRTLDDQLGGHRGDEE